MGLYILQDERCWELLPPEEELDMWITKLQLAVFGQEVISMEYVTAEKTTSAQQKLRDLKGAHFLTLQQQYGLMLATYKDRDGDKAQALSTFKDRPNSSVYIMSLEMDGAQHLLHPSTGSSLHGACRPSHPSPRLFARQTTKWRPAQTRATSPTLFGG